MGKIKKNVKKRNLNNITNVETIENVNKKKNDIREKFIGFFDDEEFNSEETIEKFQKGTLDKSDYFHCVDIIEIFFKKFFFETVGVISKEKLTEEEEKLIIDSYVDDDLVVVINNKISNANSEEYKYEFTIEDIKKIASGRYIKIDDVINNVSKYEVEKKHKQEKEKNELRSTFDTSLKLKLEISKKIIEETCENIGFLRRKYDFFKEKINTEKFLVNIIGYKCYKVYESYKDKVEIKEFCETVYASLKPIMHITLKNEFIDKLKEELEAKEWEVFGENIKKQKEKKKKVLKEFEDKLEKIIGKDGWKNSLKEECEEVMILDMLINETGKKEEEEVLEKLIQVLKNENKTEQEIRDILKKFEEVLENEKEQVILPVTQTEVNNNVNQENEEIKIKHAGFVRENTNAVSSSDKNKEEKEMIEKKEEEEDKEKKDRINNNVNQENEEKQIVNLDKEKQVELDEKIYEKIESLKGSYSCIDTNTFESSKNVIFALTFDKEKKEENKKKDFEQNVKSIRNKLDELSEEESNIKCTDTYIFMDNMVKIIEEKNERSEKIKEEKYVIDIMNETASKTIKNEQYKANHNSLMAELNIINEGKQITINNICSNSQYYKDLNVTVDLPDRMRQEYFTFLVGSIGLKNIITQLSLNCTITNGKDTEVKIKNGEIKKGIEIKDIEGDVFYTVFEEKYHENKVFPENIKKQFSKKESEKINSYGIGGGSIKKISPTNKNEKKGRTIP